MLEEQVAQYLQTHVWAQWTAAIAVMTIAGFVAGCYISRMGWDSFGLYKPPGLYDGTYNPYGCWVAIMPVVSNALFGLVYLAAGKVSTEVVVVSVVILGVGTVRYGQTLAGVDNSEGYSDHF